MFSSRSCPTPHANSRSIKLRALASNFVGLDWRKLCVKVRGKLQNFRVHPREFAAGCRINRRDEVVQLGKRFPRRADALATVMPAG